MSIGSTIVLFGGDSNTPYYTGTITAPASIPFTVSLDGVDYPVALKDYSRASLDMLRPRSFAQGQPDDEMFDTNGVFWRYRFSFDHGAGQQVLDIGTLSTDADDRRFFASRAVDPWTRYELTLAQSTSHALTCAASILPMVATGTLIYVGDGTGVKRSADGITFSSVTGLAGTVAAITTDGTDAYIATTSGIYQVTPASLAATAIGAAGSYDNVAFCSNRLLASKGAALGEVGASTFDVIFTHYQTAFRWTTMFNVGSRIYAGGFAGNRSELYALEAQSDGTLARAQEAAPFAFGELLRAGLSYGGAVILCTSLGVRFAQLGGDGNLTYGPLIAQPGDVRCATAEGRFAWFGWSNYPDSGTGLGRLALDEFVNALQPAFTTDVFSSFNGGVTVSACRFLEQTYFAIAAHGVEKTTAGAFVTSGYVDTGDIYFGTVESKAIVELLVKTEPLLAGEGIGADVTDQLGALVGSTSVATADADGFVLDMNAVIIDNCAIRLTLTGPGTTSPTLKRWRGRAYPIAPPVEQWTVPLQLNSHVVVNDSEGQMLSFDIMEQVERLVELWRTKRVVIFREGSKVHRVRINMFEVRPTQWRDDSSAFECIFVVQLASV